MSVRGPAVSPHRHAGGVSPRTLTFVIVVITVVWAVNFLAGVVIDGWQGATGVNAVMMAAIGLLGAARFRQGQTPEPPAEEPPRELPPPKELGRADE